jgi:uncharacterized protein YvpB
MRYPLLFSIGESPVVIDFDRFAYMSYNDQCRAVHYISRHEKIKLYQACEIVEALTKVRLTPFEVNQVIKVIPTFTTTVKASRPTVDPAQSAQDIIDFYTKPR